MAKESIKEFQAHSIIAIKKTILLVSVVSADGLLGYLEEQWWPMSTQNIIGSDNGLYPGRRQAII